MPFILSIPKKEDHRQTCGKNTSTATPAHVFLKYFMFRLLKLVSTLSFSSYIITFYMFSFKKIGLCVFIPDLLN